MTPSFTYHIIAVYPLATCNPPGCRCAEAVKNQSHACIQNNCEEAVIRLIVYSSKTECNATDQHYPFGYPD
ncbi:unnamed protein product [Dicrocoelium dendriticum]|nr:unnamed protein product [Dicrocoelium dendriticum]